MFVKLEGIIYFSFVRRRKSFYSLDTYAPLWLDSPPVRWRACMWGGIGHTWKIPAECDWIWGLKRGGLNLMKFGCFSLHHFHMPTLTLGQISVSLCPAERWAFLWCDWTKAAQIRALCLWETSQKSDQRGTQSIYLCATMFLCAQETSHTVSAGIKFR